MVAFYFMYSMEETEWKSDDYPNWKLYLVAIRAPSIDSSAAHSNYHIKSP